MRQSIKGTLVVGVVTLGVRVMVHALRKAAGPRRRLARSGDLSSVRGAIQNFCEGRENLAGAWKDLASAVEETILRRALDVPGTNQRELARKLGISRVTLRKKLKEYGLR